MRTKQLNDYQKEKVRAYLKYFKDEWKNECERNKLSRTKTKEVKDLIDTLAKERKSTGHKSFEYLENQFYLVRSRIEYFRLLRNYDELNTKHRKAMKLVDGIRYVVKGEI